MRERQNIGLCGTVLVQLADRFRCHQDPCPMDDTCLWKGFLDGAAKNYSVIYGDGFVETLTPFVLKGALLYAHALRDRLRGVEFAEMEATEATAWQEWSAAHLVPEDVRKLGVVLADGAIEPMCEDGDCDIGEDCPTLQLVERLTSGITSSLMIESRPINPGAQDVELAVCYAHALRDRWKEINRAEVSSRIADEAEAQLWAEWGFQ